MNRIIKSESTNKGNDNEGDISTSLKLIAAGILMGIVGGMLTYPTININSISGIELALWLVPITSFFCGLFGFVYFKFIK